MEPEHRRPDWIHRLLHMLQDLPLPTTAMLLLFLALVFAIYCLWHAGPPA